MIRSTAGRRSACARAQIVQLGLERRRQRDRSAISGIGMDALDFACQLVGPSDRIEIGDDQVVLFRRCQGCAGTSHQIASLLADGLRLPRRQTKAAIPDGLLDGEVGPSRANVSVARDQHGNGETDEDQADAAPHNAPHVLAGTGPVRRGDTRRSLSFHGVWIIDATKDPRKAGGLQSATSLATKSQKDWPGGRARSFLKGTSSAAISFVFRLTAATARVMLAP